MTLRTLSALVAVSLLTCTGLASTPTPAAPSGQSLSARADDTGPPHRRHQRRHHHHRQSQAKHHGAHAKHHGRAARPA